MTAQGKINASRVQINDRIIVKTYEGGTFAPSNTKTGEGVQIARVTGKSMVYGGCGNRRIYSIETTAGTFEAAPIQTMWLAPEDAAGVKRAHAEALAENVARKVAEPHPFRQTAPAKTEAYATRHHTDAEGIRAAYAELDTENAERAALPTTVIHPEDTPEYDEYAAQVRAAKDAPGAWDDILADLPLPAAEFNPEAGASAPDANRHASQTGGLTLHSQDGKVDSMNTESATQTAVHTGSTVVALLERVWDRIRTDHPELPEIVITTGSGEGVKWGHFRPESWKVRAAEGAAVTEVGPGRRHELFLASEALAKGAHQVLQTMLHEGAHTLSRVRGIKDTSRQGRWHNREFRKAALEMGLHHATETADKTAGFSFVTLTAATKDRYADLIGELERELVLTGLLPSWMGGTDEEDAQGGEKITGKPAKGEGETKSGPLKAVCGCEEPVIIRLSQKTLDLGVVRCDGCSELFRAA